MLPLLVAAAVAEAEPLAANDVCYRFCEDGSKPMVDRRKDCPAGTACRTTLPPDVAAFDNCDAPDTCQADPGPGFMPSPTAQNATDPHNSHHSHGGGGGENFFCGAYWVLILLFLVTLATVCYYRHLVRVAEAAELEKSEAPKREAAAAVQEVAVPLDDMDFSARTHDLYANAECSVCLAGFSADDGPVILPCAHAFHDACLKTWWATRLEGDAQITCPICRKPFGDESGPAPQDDLESGRPRADSVPSPMGSTAPLRRARPPPTIELQPANNDLETRVQPVEVPGDDDYTLS